MIPHSGEDAVKYSGPVPGAVPPDTQGAAAERPYARLGVVGLIARPDGPGWFLVEHGEPHTGWSPIGGRLEGGESLQAAMEREAREETGLRVEAVGPCYAYLTQWKGEKLLAVSMACRVKDWPVEVHLETEFAGWRWATGEEWARLAREGRSWWSESDVKRGTTLADCLLGINSG